MSAGDAVMPLALVVVALLLLLDRPVARRGRIAVARPGADGAAPAVPRSLVTSLLAAIAARRHREERARACGVEVAELWASAVRAGAPPRAALADAVEGAVPAADAAARALRWGGDPHACLLRVPGGPSARQVRVLAACLVLAESTGASVAPVLERAADALRDEQAVADELAAQAAAPRATAWLLALLPLSGPVLGALVGARTVEILTGTAIGRVCLVGGLLLDAAGVLWVRHLLRRAGPAAP